MVQQLVGDAVTAAPIYLESFVSDLAKLVRSLTGRILLHEYDPCLLTGELSALNDVHGRFKLHSLTSAGIKRGIVLSPAQIVFLSEGHLVKRTISGGELTLSYQLLGIAPLVAPENVPDGK